MNQGHGLRPYAVVFGPDANCTLSTCDLAYSVYKYRPSLAANAAFIGLYSAALALHAFLGWRWRSWRFATCIIAGCLLEVIGYAGRIMLHGNPFSFEGFMIQIIFVTVAPVFYTASIYVTLAEMYAFLNSSGGRFY